jgi:transcriptional regulator with XRE-family HTH domain
MNLMGIKTKLIKKSLYQYALADKLGVSETFLSKVLSGRISPTQELKKKIYKALK